MSVKHTVSGTTSAATLMHVGQALQLPVRSGTIGPDVVDVANLYKETGCFTYDPGFTSTANCSSKITYIDGDKGELLYRGYPIEQLAENSNFLAVCYLLLYGELPANDEFRKFRTTITYHTMVNERVRLGSIWGFVATPTPWQSWLASLGRCVGLLSTTLPTSRIRCSE